MKNLLVFAIALTTLVLAACSNNDSKAIDESLSPATSTKPVTPLTIADTLLSDTASSRSAAAIASPITSVPKTATTTISNTTSSSRAGLNPAHGQPGHRCDIAVGASLSTPPSSTTPQVKSVTNNPSPITVPSPIATPSAITNSGSGKLNPPHGQPGHDCAVEVGKPLKN